MDLLVLLLFASTLSMGIVPSTASETEDRHLIAVLCRYFPWLRCCRYGVLGRACHYATDCSVFLGNTVCSGGRCRCASGFEQINGKCVQQRKTIGDPCTTDLECSASILNGVCSTATSLCACSDGKVEYNTTTCADRCPSGWDFNSEFGKCYFVSTEQMTWTAAEDHCVSFGGHLASIHSQEEMDFLFSKMEKYDYYWVGGNDVAEAGTWTWIDGSPFEFEKWISRYPSATTNWNCMQITHSGGGIVSGMVNYSVCEIARPFICKADPVW